ncbi:ImmA/IrrE family metallo-endopeptidase [Acetobacterium malicum]|uniref:ImmA/IrrE family metallo-endopeptidase n=1 Tax=Acetobacterium malicum TaxID=52692 RepID=A0ABR6Z1V8_9FIRM|nr:ImmA/IrrE family metallo-endopeptidase [Acetobacterium malicum]MBC3901496.1 ImmA/IrrE family metallo-endopeptidase [Acetobacterium malicum]
MNQLALRKSNLMKKRYNIDSFPIPLWQIEQAIIDQGFDIVISKSLCKSCIIKKTVYVPHTMDFISRFMLSHELGHILCHNCDIHRLDDISKEQLESQANAFSVYFLIPTRRFKIDSKIYNAYELSELYGVPVGFINSCVKKYLAN